MYQGERGWAIPRDWLLKPSQWQLDLVLILDVKSQQ